MVGIFLKTGLSSREFLEMSFSGLGTTFLKTLAKRGHALSILFNSLPAEGFAFGIRSQIDDTKIDTQCSPFWFNGIRNWHVKGYCKGKCSLAVEQICLTL